MPQGGARASAIVVLQPKMVRSRPMCVEMYAEFFAVALGVLETRPNSRIEIPVFERDAEFAEHAAVVDAP